MDKPDGVRTIDVVRRVLLPLVAVLAALVAASSALAENPVVSAVKRTSDARSSVLDMQVTTSAGGSSVVLTGTGATRGTDVKVSMKVGAGAGASTMDVILLREPSGFVMYMRTPALRSQLPAGKSWLRVDFEKEAAKLGVDFSGLLDASQTLGPLQRGLVSTTRVGRETVAGKPTTHYRAVVDVHRAAAALPSYAKQVRAIEKAMGARLGRTTQEVWVGTDGRIRRLRSSTPTVVQGVEATSVQTMTFRAYDVPVSIAAPPRAQVFDFS
jgi:hypothetical protein